MKESLATITAKGQVIISAGIRRALGLKPKDKVAFVFNQGKYLAIIFDAQARLWSSQTAEKPENFEELRGEIENWIVQKAEEELYMEYAFLDNR